MPNLSLIADSIPPDLGYLLLTNLGHFVKTSPQVKEISVEQLESVSEFVQVLRHSLIKRFPDMATVVERFFAAEPGNVIHEYIEPEQHPLMKEK